MKEGEGEGLMIWVELLRGGLGLIEEWEGSRSVSG